MGAEHSTDGSSGGKLPAHDYLGAGSPTKNPKAHGYSDFSDPVNHGATVHQHHLTTGGSQGSGAKSGKGHDDSSTVNALPPGGLGGGAGAGGSNKKTFVPIREIGDEEFFQLHDIQSEPDEVMKWIEKHGANICNSRGVTLLHLSGSLAYVRYLINVGIDPNVRDSFGRRPLHFRAERGAGEGVLEMLVNAGGDPNVRDKRGNTPLHVACSSNRFTIARDLVEKFGAKIDARNIEGQTPFHECGWKGSLRCLKFLVEYADAKADSITTSDSATTAAANALKKLFDAKDSKMEATPLAGAVTEGHVNVVNYLLSKGADLNTTDAEGDTLLHRATWDGRNDMVQLLLDRGIPVDITNGTKLTPLHSAVYNKHHNTVKLLVDNGANVNSQDETGDTPLHVAVEGNCLDLVRYLCVRGANIFMRNKEKVTPRLLAFHLKEDIAILEFLRKFDEGLDKAKKRLLAKESYMASESSSPATSAASPTTISHKYKKRVLVFYQKWAPEKQANVEAIMEKFLGREKELMMMLVAKYGPEPTPEEAAHLAGLLTPGEEQEKKEHEQDKKAAHAAADIFATTTTTAAAPAAAAASSSATAQQKEETKKDDDAEAETPLNLDLDAVLAGEAATITTTTHAHPAKGESTSNSLESTAFVLDDDWLNPPLTHDEMSALHDEAHKHALDAAAADDSNSPPQSPASPQLREAQASIWEAATAGLTDRIFSILEKHTNRRKKLINKKDSKGCTAVFKAASAGQVGALKMLCAEEGVCDVRVRDAAGWTPLMAACFFNHLDCVKILIDLGSDVNARNNRGDTALHLAAQGASKTLLRLLVLHGADAHLKNDEEKTPLEVATANHKAENVEYLRIASAFAVPSGGEKSFF